MRKKINFKSVEEVRNKAVEDAMDAWIAGANEKEPILEEEVMKRISISVTDSFHKQLKHHCVREGITIKEKIINLLTLDMRL